MDTNALINAFKTPSKLQLSDLENINAIIEKYPYFQAAKALQLKALKNQGSHLYNQKLKETAAYTTNREVLFNFITSKAFSISETKEIAIEEPETTLAPTEITNVDKNNFLITESEANQIADPFLFEEKKEIAPVEINITEPLEFDKKETHSFSEWLKLSKLQPIKRDEEKLNKSALIDNFIKNTPKISPVNKSAPIVNLAKKNNTPSTDLMTETLAKVYLAQKNYKKAIQAYKILILKNPEKSGLFADQIRAIEKLKDNK